MTTNIEWCKNPDGSKGETWNVLTGCDHKSDGCTNCYAARMATRLVGRGDANYRGSVKGGKWTGKIKLLPDALDKPLHWKKPRTIFVQSMGDLFHDKVPFEFIDKVFAVMAIHPRHTFMILTKRPERMSEYAGTQRNADRFFAFCLDAARGLPIKLELQFLDDNCDGFQLPNVRLYTSIEDQATADERIPWLLKTPAVVHGLSIEPMLGPVDLRLEADAFGVRIDHVIVGGESGPGARPMHPDWVRSVRDQCVEAGVKFFFKSWGEWCAGEATCCPGHTFCRGRNTRYGCKPARVGKRAAGRELDGRTWDEMPGQAKEETNG